MKKHLIRTTAYTLLLTLGFQLVFPVCSYALTTGPSQPEVQSFEPIGTTDMVDMFSGDFNYNIPLLDVEGYPVNIFYHSGIGIEQEASWVGLGWNINVGEINRSVRGLPDDFNGDLVEKYLNIKTEKETRMGLGANFAIELFGLNKVNLGGTIGTYLASNNYRGMSAGVNFNAGLNMPGVSVGIGMGIGSQTGADIDFNASVTTGALLNSNIGSGLSTSLGTGFNSRSGLKSLSLDARGYTDVIGKGAGRGGTGFGVSIPVGLQNYVPVITNRVLQNSEMAQIKVGGVAIGFFTGGYFNVTQTQTAYEKTGHRPGYGFLYAENADKSAILDFTRDKDGMYNKTMKNLPSSSMTYDVYSVSGQGTGGMFRPFRNDIGSIYDPYVSSLPPSTNKSKLLEAGIGNVFHAGADINVIETENTSGAWSGHELKFGAGVPGSLYEKVFFKNGGELTYNQQQEAPQLFNNAAQYVAQDMLHLKSVNGGAAGTLPATFTNGARILWNDGVEDRSSRATQISWQTAKQAAIPDMALSEKIVSYENGTAGNFYDPKLVSYQRYSDKSASTVHPGSASSLSEFTQTLSDGRRYVYGIPAMNNLTREVTFAVNETKASLRTGTVGFNVGTDDNVNNPNGKDNYFSATHTPAYAHSFLLTSVLSNDYVDILGDGPTDDDPGSFVKFNYTMTDKDYRWRTPFSKDSAQYNPGFWSDKNDGKGNYMVGSRQQWYIRSIESKNYVAEFYTSPRVDGLGITDAVIPAGTSSKLARTSNLLNLNAAKTSGSYSYKLDSIRLFNKNDRYLNKDNATPIKTVIFKYDYSLCPNVPNSTATTKGKLTLQAIYMRYGKSQKNLLSPYTFTYNNGDNAQNLSYDFAAKDRWGNYKPVDTGLYNFEFPFTRQPLTAAAADTQNRQLAAWNLTRVSLPSGGHIDVSYESDDYAFVQDRRAMQMFVIDGLGSTTTRTRRNNLYTDANNVNDYIYFRRSKDQERPGFSLRDNYLEGQDHLMYDFSIDIGNTGRAEHVKGYAKIADMGICADNDSFGYVRVARESFGSAGGLHPAMVLGINTGRYYLPQLMYKGLNGDDGDLKNILEGLIGAAGELGNTMAGQNPVVSFMNKQKARNITINKSWIRLQMPGLAKKGGGIRVKRLTLSDNWAALAGPGASEATYGKTYDYTITDPRYGKISSGVASYEPMIGGEENPFRRPVPYDADAGRMLPAIQFFQEEPYGESFFPGPSVGYSSVKVNSIHAAEGRSSQAQDEYLFYTAKDFPILIDYTQKDVARDGVSRSLTSTTQEAEVLQGYAIRMNDMHGKPKAVNNYVLHTDGGRTQTELITGVQYNYNTDSRGQLDNNVTALSRQRGTLNTYQLKKIILGQDIDFSVDTRSRESVSDIDNVAVNADGFAAGIFPGFVPTVFYSYKKESNIFHSMVTTKLIQQYGILQSVESFDHGAKTKTENLVYDAETGSVLLSRVNNQFNDQTYSLGLPAYMAYEGMRPAYTNTGYEETADSLVVTKERDGFLYTNNLERFTPGDELLVTARAGFATKTYKLWVTGMGANNSFATDPPAPVDSGTVVFGKFPTTPGPEPASVWQQIDAVVTVNIYNTLDVRVAGGAIDSLYKPVSKWADPTCGQANCLTLSLPAGSYYYNASGGVWPKSFSVTKQPFDIVKSGCVSFSFYMVGYYITGAPAPAPEAIRTVTVTADGKTEERRCGLTVEPRYKIKKLRRSTTDYTDQSSDVWPINRVVYKDVSIKVIRSGRRNNLDKQVQQMTITPTPDNAASTLTSLTTNINYLLNWQQRVVSASVNTYTDAARMYAGFDNSFHLPSTTGTIYGSFNDFVLGKRGTYRPASSYAPVASRAYDNNHARTDGTYTFAQPFWLFVNSRATSDVNSCAIATDVLQYYAATVPSTAWKRASTVTAYDIYGNALEEKDAIGNYTTAQYGYNKSLPVAVATNAQQGQTLYDGFEDYNMLVPQTTAQLFNKQDLYNPMAPALSDVIADITAAYPSETATGATYAFSRYGQLYNLRNYAPAGTGVVSRNCSHTGRFSYSLGNNQSIAFNIAAPDATAVNQFQLNAGTKYLLSFWAKNGDLSSTPISGNITMTIGAGTELNILNTGTKTNNVDGWYRYESIVDLGGVTDGTYTLYCKNTAGLYIDDIRLLPFNANMKSFVYDPVNYKLMAQLDENNMATFYEYDQEGLLIRTKKETDRGIMTISENRRANAKK